MKNLPTTNHLLDPRLRQFFGGQEYRNVSTQMKIDFPGASAAHIAEAFLTACTSAPPMCVRRLLLATVRELLRGSSGQGNVPNADADAA